MKELEFVIYKSATNIKKMAAAQTDMYDFFVISSGFNLKENNKIITSALISTYVFLDKFQNKFSLNFDLTNIDNETDKWIVEEIIENSKRPLLNNKFKNILVDGDSVRTKLIFSEKIPSSNYINKDLFSFVNKEFIKNREFLLNNKIKFSEEELIQWKNEFKDFFENTFLNKVVVLLSDNLKELNFQDLKEKTKLDKPINYPKVKI